MPVLHCPYFVEIAGIDVVALAEMDSDLTGAEKALIKAALTLSAKLDVTATCNAMLNAVEEIAGATSSWILLRDPSAELLVSQVFRGQGAEVYSELEIPWTSGIVGLVFSTREPVFVPDVTTEDRWYDPERVRRSGLRSVLCLPLLYEGTPMGVLGLDSPRFTAATPPTPAELSRLQALAAQAAIGVSNARLYEAAESDRQRLRRLVEERRQLRNEVGHLRTEIRQTSGSGIVGESHGLREVLSQVQLVAPADSTVLIVGETGTGKELIARSIHHQSRRSTKPFIAVNCAALPENLVESELFGHEKGAFTGALVRKPGKFELAHTGTLFLDEIGDLPLDAQSKLLRVLQDREVHRVGAIRPVPVNVRVVAATNQDLAECMQQGRFRADLYYRLSVFPISLPPLRERSGDIPILVEHFVRLFAERQHKRVPRVSPAALERILSYDWPGNIRELQNVIERAVILTNGPAIQPEAIPLARSARPQPTSAARPVSVTEMPPTRVVHFSEAERRAIIRALEQTGWRISGQHGAAELLGLKPTTLHAKMKKLGIRRPSPSELATG